MEVSTFQEIQVELLERVNKMVYCNMATIDTSNRPRSRLMHPVWEESIVWIISWQKTPKTKHLAHNPHVSLAYVQDINKPVYVDAKAEWVTDRDEQLRVWDYYKTVPPPMGFDPEPHYGTIDHEHFGLLKLTPSKIELYTLRGESVIWRRKQGQ